MRRSLAKHAKSFQDEWQKKYFFKFDQLTIAFFELVGVTIKDNIETIKKKIKMMLTMDSQIFTDFLKF